MSTPTESTRLDRAPDEAVDHILGLHDAPITLVEYGSYACPHCRAANERITEVRGELGERLRYVFRHRPLTNNDLARRAAELVECAPGPGQFWDAHVALMTRSSSLTENDLRAVAADLGFGPEGPGEETITRARARVEADEASARASDVRVTPTFFINGRKYVGPWDESSFTDAMLNTFGHRVRVAALSFASWAPSAGLLLLFATILAIAASNSPLGEAFAAFWQTELALGFGAAEFRLPLVAWVNDALLTIFFLVVGLEIKRELTVGHLASRRQAALPIAAAIGGMAVPALIYRLVIPDGDWAHGWGVPMATDTAFAIAVIALLGARAPIELRIFLTAAAIVDDIGAILVVAVFYSGALDWPALGAAAAVVVSLVLLNRAGVYRPAPYVLLGVLLWIFVHEGGLHATLAGVLLAALIPTRPPPDYRTLFMQAEAILTAEAAHSREQYRRGPSEPALHAIDAIHDRLESPADRMLRTVGPRSTYFVLPVFALANAGVAIGFDALQGYEPLMLAIAAGLVIGKPAGFLLATALAVRIGLAQKPDAYSWRQLAGASALAGIGFTMSLFIAGEAFPDQAAFGAAKIAVFGASLIAALLGAVLLWGNARRTP